jgi:DNA mismatch repair protein MutL
MTGRYPAAFVFLDLPAGEVDVNAHPTKAEVRLRDRGAVSALVRDAVRSRLDEAKRTARAATARKEKPDGRADWETPQTAEPAAPAAERRTERVSPRPAAGDSPASGAAAAQGGEPPTGQALFPAEPAAADAVPTQRGAPTAVRALQVLGCYLVVEVPPDELLIVDQHALHERVLFERLRARLASGVVESQRLVTPEVVDLPPAQAAVVLAHRDALAGLGLLVEDFGGGAVLLAGYPAVLGGQPRTELLRAVAEHLQGQGRLPGREDLIHDLAALAACHAAVRSGDRLSEGEMEGLLADLDLVRDAHHCPHGRPTAVAFGRRDLERLFKRV